MNAEVGPIIRQGEAPHAQLRLGDGPRTVSQAGCLLCCLTQAARLLTSSPRLLVEEALLRIRRNGGFARALDGHMTSALVVPAAALAVGLKVVERTKSLDEVERWLDDGKLVIVGVDYKDGASSGFSAADHFVLAVKMKGRVLTVADPAFGRLLPLELDHLAYKGITARLTEAIFLDAAPT